MISTLRVGLVVRHKYKAARLEKAFKDITRRRNEQLGPSATGKILFPLGRGLCATYEAFSFLTRPPCYLL